jgi:trk system potassium uptake protein TrkA
MRFIVLGCGRLGAGLAHALLQRRHAVAVVDRNPAALARLGPAFGGQAVAGAALDRDILLRAGIERADGLAAVLTSDEVNLVAARLARQLFRVPRVVARLRDPRTAEIARRLGVQPLSTTTWGIQRAAELLCYSPLDSLFSLGEGEADLVEAEVPLLLVGRPVQEVTIPGEAHVVALSRDGRLVLPTSGALFRPGDRVLMIVVAAAADRLKRLLALA